MRRFVRIKKASEKPQAAIVHCNGDVYYPLFLHSTIDQDRTVGSRATFSEHVHDLYHILLYTRGQGWYLKEGVYLPAQAGTCVLVHPGQKHEFVTRRQSAIYSELTFGYESDKGPLKMPFAELFSCYFGSRVQLTQDSILPPKQRQGLYNMIVQITDYLNSSAPLASYYAHRTLSHIFDFLLEHCTRQAVPPELVDDRFNRVRFWLEENYLEPVTIDQLAQMAGVARSYFFRAFKKAFGMPPLTYQQLLRIESAKTLLRATSLNCNEIASRSGFTDVCFFHRVFRKHTGCTPKKFRADRL
jgi:AraC-like DNA-binding protein